MKPKKKLSTLMISLVLLLGMLAVFPTVQATDFHIIKGTLYIDEVVAGAGINIELEVIGNPFTLVTFEQDENGYNFFSSGFEDATYGDATVYFTVIYNGTSYTPIDNASIVLNKNTNDIEVYILDLNVDTSEPANSPPNTPSGPSPSNGATGVSISTDLSWTGGDPDGDTITYDVYFGTSSTPPLKSSDQTSKSYDVGTLSYSTKYYWKIIAEDEHGLTATGSIWSFTTKDSGGGGPPPPPPPPPSGGGNIAPTAEAGGPYFGVVGEVITFDGSGSSDSDGDVVEYRWDFDNDGTYDTDWSDSATATHSYSSIEELTVKLQVKDDGAATDTDTATVLISKFNNPPTAPVISGPQSGSVDTDYDYSAVSTDADDDAIQYTFYWGDTTTTTTDYFANATAVDESHNWSSYGFYTITVQAYDSNTTTTSDGYVVAIDVMWVKDIGYLIDIDSDGTFESFYSNETGIVTDTEKQTDGTYLINSNDDSLWDWIYDPNTDTLTEYSEAEPESTEEDNSLWYAVGILVIILVIGIILFAGRKKGKKGKKPKK